MDGFSAFTHGVRSQNPFTPFDTSGQASTGSGRTDFEVAQLPFLG
jgi:hypothetical protein